MISALGFIDAGEAEPFIEDDVVDLRLAKRVDPDDRHGRRQTLRRAPEQVGLAFEGGRGDGDALGRPRSP